jgi:hypothetical protein
LENTVHKEESFFVSDQNTVYCSYNEEYTFQKNKSQNYKGPSGVFLKILKGKHRLSIVASIKLVDYFSSFLVINISTHIQSFIVKSFDIRNVSALFDMVKWDGFWKENYASIKRANYHNNQSLGALIC